MERKTRQHCHKLCPVGTTVQIFSEVDVRIRRAVNIHFISFETLFDMRFPNITLSLAKS